MQTATVMARVNRETVIKKVGVTPAECVILREMFTNKAGGEVIVSAVQTDDISGANEVTRLKSWYKGKIIEKLWPGVTKKLPQTFEEVGVKVAAKPVPVPVDEPAGEPVEVPVEVTPKVKKSKLV